MCVNSVKKGAPAPRSVDSEVSFFAMSEQELATLLAGAWRRVDEGLAAVRALSAPAPRLPTDGPVDLEVAVALALDRSMRAEETLATGLNEFRDALAMAEAVGVAPGDLIAHGLADRPLALVRARLGAVNGTAAAEALLSAETERPLRTVRERIQQLALLPMLASTPEPELTAMLEAAAVTSYLVPGDAHLPNWPNVACALEAVGRMNRVVTQAAHSLEATTRAQLEAKLRRVAVAAFNSRALRHPTVEAVAGSCERSRRFLALILDLFADRAEQRRKHAHVLGQVTEDVPPSVESGSSLEAAQHTFRSVLVQHCWALRLLPVEGDGNCFFRAVVKALTPHVPRDHEDMLSLELRKSINSAARNGPGSPRAILADFEVEHESDASTMAQAGVWADHVQMAKVAALLQRSVWLVRCDDDELQLDASGRLVPSEHYRIGGEATTLEPVVLFYQVELSVGCVCDGF